MLSRTDRRGGDAVVSFYHLHRGTLEQASCHGLACFVARQAQHSALPVCGGPPVHCLGQCFRAPIGGDAGTPSDWQARPRVASLARETVLLGNLVNGGAATLVAYQAAGGFRGLAHALRQTPLALAALVTESGLRGRGGAGYPAGHKWTAVLAEAADEKFVVANADEGDAGAYSDRLLMEDDPFRLIEGMAIAAYAVGARRGFIYLRKEYPQALPVLYSALEEARQAQLLGPRILGVDFAFDIDIFVGEGSYLCGEETALLNSIEQRRPEVRGRPPWISSHGLCGKPTLMHNVETLAAVPWLVNHGATAYRSLGFGESRGTKLISLNSLFRWPGLYEVEFGISLREIVEEIGGGLWTGMLKGVIVGGPLAGIVPPGLLDTRLGYEELQAIGCSVGHGGIIGFDEHTPLLPLLRQVFQFASFESCGKCTPCRRGSAQMAERLAEACSRGAFAAADVAQLRELVTALRDTSFCGHGRALAEFAASALQYFEAEIAPCQR